MYSLRKQIARNAGKPPHARLRGPEKKSCVANRRFVDDAISWENVSLDVTLSSTATWSHCEFQADGSRG